MKEIRNTTHLPVRVPLPQGRVLHLGPLQTGEVTAHTLEHPPFQELVAAGRIEVLGDGEPQSRNPFKEPRGPAEPGG
jgi:hypothetical protein